MASVPARLRWVPPVPPQELAEGMEAAATPSIDFYLPLLVSGIIATLGLIANSVASEGASP